MVFYTIYTEIFINNGIVFHSMELDEKDHKVLELLKKDSKLRTSQMSKILKMPTTTVHNRIKKLEKIGVIKNYTVIPDHKKLGKDIISYILVTVMYVLPSGERVYQEEVAKKIKQIGAEEVHIVTGGTDIIIKVIAKNVEELNEFVITKLRSVEGVDKTQTMIVLKSF